MQRDVFRKHEEKESQETKLGYADLLVDPLDAFDEASSSPS
jgi:hypothetical protein